MWVRFWTPRWRTWWWRRRRGLRSCTRWARRTGFTTLASMKTSRKRYARSSRTASFSQDRAAFRASGSRWIPGSASRSARSRASKRSAAFRVSSPWDVPSTWGFPGNPSWVLWEGASSPRNGSRRAWVPRWPPTLWAPGSSAPMTFARPWLPCASPSASCPRNRRWSERDPDQAADRPRRHRRPHRGVPLLPPLRHDQGHSRLADVRGPGGHRVRLDRGAVVPAQRPELDHQQPEDGLGDPLRDPLPARAPGAPYPYRAKPSPPRADPGGRVWGDRGD